MPVCIWMRKDNAMNNFLSSKALKQISRGQLLGKYKTTIPSYLMVQMILLVVMQFAAAQSTSSVTGLLLYYAISFIVTLFSGIFTFGQCRLYLRIAREDTCFFEDTWYGFKNYPDKAIGIQFILGMVELLCGIPFYICYALLETTKNTSFAIPFALTLILFVVLVTIFNLMFSQAFYLLHDHPDRKVLELIKESMGLMQGHKLRLFYISVSFLGLQFLGILTMGIGLLWVTPYMYMVRANFYENLTMGLKQESGTINVTL